MSLKVAQTFYIDKTVVNGAETVTLDSVDLYFKSKPRPSSNRSGIVNPGVTVYILHVTGDGEPDVDQAIDGTNARREYLEIVASADASIATTFQFPQPVILPTNSFYAIVVHYDGSEEFDLWSAKEGEFVVKTNTVSSGASARNIGKNWEYTNGANSGWQALNNVDLKFTVRVCQYGNVAANTVTANTTITDTYILPCNTIEYIMFNRYHTSTRNPNSFKMGEIMFQETPVIYGTLTVSSNSTIITTNSNNINFSTLFPAPAVGTGLTLTSDPVVRDYQYIVLRNGSTQSANVDVIEVDGVISNTQLQVTRLPKFSSNTATFSLTPAGELTNKNYHFYTGRWFDYTANVFNRFVGFKTDVLVLDKSNANSTLHFVNNMLSSITIKSGGTGYSNSDVITVHPILDSNTANSQNIAYIPSYANATANIVTNGTGTITGIAVSNTGFGMSSNVAYSITTSAGSGANLSVTVGSLVRGAESNAMYGDCVVLNMPVNRAWPQIRLLTNQHHVTNVVHHYPYYVMPNTEHIVVQSNTAMKRVVDILKNNPIVNLDFNDGRIHVHASRSNEVQFTSNVTIQLANNALKTTQLKSSSIVEVTHTSNNIYTVPAVDTTTVYHNSYIINNDITNERKGHGNALCRHISEKVTFADNRNAEDIAVYCDLYRPAGTNINVYARLLNVSDQEAFDDKDWTELELKSNNASIVSSLTDETDILEFSYGLPSAPSSVNTITGSATLVLNQANISGVGTNWSTDLQVNDVVKFYSPLFPDDYMVSVVRNIANNTQITIDDAVTSTDLTSSTMTMDLIGRPANGANAEIGNPFQAFIYEPNNFTCRYYDSSMGKQDTYNTFAIKLVLTSNNSSIVPKVHNTRAVGVSA